MEESQVEELYNWMDRVTEKIQTDKDEPYIESLVLTLKMRFELEVPQELTAGAKKDLSEDLKAIKPDQYEVVTIRKAIQLAVLKGMKVAQGKHLMTPETVALIIGYLAGKLTADQEETRIFDPVCGTGNLLTIVAEELQKKTHLFASEVDPTLIQLAVNNANLQKKEIEFFHQDSMEPFLLDPVDLVVADLPVGYYPDTLQANPFTLKSDSGMSYAHHLILEQSLHYTKAGGYSIFVIPSFLFESDGADKLQAFLHETAHIVGVLQLPETAFASDKNTKSILILQKKTPQITAPKQPLLVKLPSLKNARAMKDIIDQMDTWFAEFMKNNQL